MNLKQWCISIKHKQNIKLHLKIKPTNPIENSKCKIPPLKFKSVEGTRTTHANLKVSIVVEGTRTTHNTYHES